MSEVKYGISARHPLKGDDKWSLFALVDGHQIVLASGDGRCPYALRAALCQPDPAAEARATLSDDAITDADSLGKLKQAVLDDLIGDFRIGLTAENEWGVWVPGKHSLTECIGAGERMTDALAAAAAQVDGMRKVETRFPISDLDLCGCRNELAELTHNQVGMSQTGAPVCWIAGERYEMEEDEDLLHYYQRLVVAAQSDQYNLRAQARAAKQ